MKGSMQEANLGELLHICILGIGHHVGIDIPVTRVSNDMVGVQI